MCNGKDLGEPIDLWSIMKFEHLKIRIYALWDLWPTLELDTWYTLDGFQKIRNQLEV